MVGSHHPSARGDGGWYKVGHHGVVVFATDTTRVMGTARGIIHQGGG